MILRSCTYEISSEVHRVLINTISNDGYYTLLCIARLQRHNPQQIWIFWELFGLNAAKKIIIVAQKDEMKQSVCNATVFITLLSAKENESEQPNEQMNQKRKH